ncbi:polyprenyl synthetase family protein [Streptomyces sp. NPDC047108]|uniref:polyprenyl synthetase family protein n=1 Tax=Streptomyces sp. NPDC047108 TaxID=3155025 RepID=UPI0033C794BE
MTTPNPATHVPGRHLAAARPTLAMLQRELHARWQPDDERVHRISRYALVPAGKMLRPLLLVESAAALGNRRELFLPAALGVEYLHVGSLVHDDVIDGDALRRGRPTVSALHGTTDAIVTGDSLMMRMFSAVAECASYGLPPSRVLEAVRILAQAGMDQCSGQAMEGQLRGNIGCGLPAYYSMTTLKTGALFRGACRAGVALGGGSAEDDGTLTGYAHHLGRAFQMHDDLLPHISDSAATGKPDLSDMANHRPTFPVLLCHEMSGPSGRARLSAALAGRIPTAEAHQVVQDLLDSTGALDLAQERSRTESELAKTYLTRLPVTESVEILAAVADLAVDREN